MDEHATEVDDERTALRDGRVPPRHEAVWKLGAPAFTAGRRVDGGCIAGRSGVEGLAVTGVAEVVDLVVASEVEARDRLVGTARERAPLPAPMLMRRRVELRGRRAGIALLEERTGGCERRDIRRPLRALVRGARLREEDGDDDERDRGGGCDRGDGGDRARMTPREPPQFVAARGGAREERQAFDEVAEFLREFGGAAVAIGGIRRERLLQHRVGRCGQARGLVGAERLRDERRDGRG